LRFQNYPEVQQVIIDQKSPMGVKMKARKNRELLNRGAKWDEHPTDLPLMKMCLELKIDQHPQLKTELLKTGNAVIIEDCTTHDRESARFWGMVKKDGLALRYVLKKTPEIVLAAVKQNKEAKKHMAGSCFNIKATPKQLIEFYKI